MLYVIHIHTSFSNRCVLFHVNHFYHNNQDDMDDGTENLGFSLVGEEIRDQAVEYKDEGYIELVLKVLAGMCDGQFDGLQVSLCSQIS